MPKATMAAAVLALRGVLLWISSVDALATLPSDPSESTNTDTSVTRRKTTKGGSGGSSSVTWPNLKDQEAVQKFFLAQVQAGEELLAQGEIESGVEHLSRAVAVCGQPQQLLQVLQQTLPPQVFQLLLHKLPAVGESILQAAGGSKVTEEDVE